MKSRTVYLNNSQFIVFSISPSFYITYSYVYEFFVAEFKLVALGYFISWYLVEIIRHDIAIS